MPRQYDRQHLRQSGKAVSERYQSFASARTKAIVRSDPRAHAERVMAGIEVAIDRAEALISERDPQLVGDRKGVILSFNLEDSDPKSIDSLVSERRKAELVIVKKDNEGVMASIFVPDDQLEKYKDDLFKKVKSYSSSDGKNNSALVSRIKSTYETTLHTIFTDDLKDFPKDGERIWWEVWSSTDRADNLLSVAQKMGLPVAEEELVFPDRRIFAIESNSKNMEILFLNSSSIDELRLIYDTPETFIEMENLEQIEWSDDLLGRITYSASDPEIAVLILDGGTTRSHKLIQPFLNASDWQCFESAWLPDDNSRFRKIRGHGTSMAGIALYGDLHKSLLATSPISLKHRLETMKILPPRGANPKRLYGSITKQAVEGMEITNPLRKRIITIALTSPYQTRSGRPSSWSAAIDQMGFGMEDEDYRRLVILAAGNINTPIDPKIYIDYTELNREITSEIESPAQAWNALTIGAYTDKVNISSLPGHTAYGMKGDLSPTSRTSFAWDQQWPIKPDVVFEGGNLITDGVITSTHSSLSLLTTNYDPRRSHYTDFGDTSAATALAAHMAAQLYSDVPQRWPETVRGLIVHSAEWTPAMRGRLGAKNEYVVDAMRHYGYGVPNIDRARFSADNDVTLIIEERLQPFKLVGGEMQFGDIHFHPLPWPKSFLEALENLSLEMRVTLSYFIEPNPSERGRGIRYRYASHGLRFDLKGSAEDDKSFRQRMNKLAREEEDYSGRTFKSHDWAIGSRTRQKAGSVFSDWWRGPAVDLASCDAIAVYPTSGWWKAKPRLPYIERRARYSLIVSIRTVNPENAIDLYTPILNEIKIDNSIII